LAGFSKDFVLQKLTWISPLYRTILARFVAIWLPTVLFIKLCARKAHHGCLRDGSNASTDGGDEWGNQQRVQVR